MAMLTASPRTSLRVTLPSAASEREALEAALDALAPIFTAVPAMDGERDGALLVVSDDAGRATAVSFWRDALRTGLALASPGAFPWCLANAPCATIAQRFGVTGANVTWLASFSDPCTAFAAPAAWLADRSSWGTHDGAPTPAWLVAMQLRGPAPQLMAWRWTDPGAGACDDDRSGLHDAIRDALVSAWSAEPS